MENIKMTQEIKTKVENAKSFEDMMKVMSKCTESEMLSANDLEMVSGGAGSQINQNDLVYSIRFLKSFYNLSLQDTINYIDNAAPDSDLYKFFKGASADEIKKQMIANWDKVNVSLC